LSAFKRECSGYTVQPVFCISIVQSAGDDQIIISFREYPLAGDNDPVYEGIISDRKPWFS